MNTSEKALLYLGFAALIVLLIAHVLRYIELKDMSSISMFAWVIIVRAYQQYAKRLQRRNEELEALLATPTTPAV
ncbi:hypothetical protein GCM10027346_07940 [Hymenobacter seoulensis]